MLTEARRRVYGWLLIFAGAALLMYGGYAVDRRTAMPPMGNLTEYMSWLDDFMGKTNDLFYLMLAGAVLAVVGIIIVVRTRRSAAQFVGQQMSSGSQ